MLKRIGIILFVCFFTYIEAQELAQIQLIQNIIEPFMKNNEVPGMAVAFYDGSEGHFLNFGVTNRENNQAVASDTIFEIASITKVFTSTDLALEVVRGKVSLEDPLVKYLPALKDGEIDKVTLLNLATHSSSLPRVAPNPHSRADVIHFLQKWQPSQKVGSHYLYSNLGFGLIGYALENIQKKPLQQVYEDDILLPLGMYSTMILVPDKLMGRYAQGYSKKGMPAPKYKLNAIPAGGALRSTSEDMLKFLEANLMVRGPAELLEAMKLAQKGYFRVNDNLTMGLGWQRVYLDGQLTIDKNGGVKGFSSYIGMIPEKRIGIVLLMNKGKGKSTYIGRQLLRSLAHN